MLHVKVCCSPRYKEYWIRGGCKQRRHGSELSAVGAGQHQWLRSGWTLKLTAQTHSESAVSVVCIMTLIYLACNLIIIACSRWSFVTYQVRRPGALLEKLSPWAPWEHWTFRLVSEMMDSYQRVAHLGNCNKAASLSKLLCTYFVPSN